jgi:hypothetical protein
VDEIEKLYGIKLSLLTKTIVRAGDKSLQIFANSLDILVVRKHVERTPRGKRSNNLWRFRSRS